MSEFTVTFVVSSDSSEKLGLAKQLAIASSHPDRLHTDIGRSKDIVELHNTRIGDYFTYIRVVDCAPTSFELVFAPRSDAGRYWKDLVVGILASIRDEAGVLVQPPRQP